MLRQLLVLSCLVLSLTPALHSQRVRPNEREDLKFVVYLTRHGVRSPTGKAAQYNVYSTAPWPTWDVPPGNLTTHGYHLMEIFGAYNRIMFAQQGLLSADGCSDASSVTFYADSDQRTRETGKALAAGLFPGCNVPIEGLAEGTNDPLFHPVPAFSKSLDRGLASAAIAGRIGKNPENLTEAHHTQLASLDKLLSTCGASTASSRKRISLFEIPSTLSPGEGDHPAELKGPLNTASTLTENLLLEYTEGMDASNVGWGCVDGATLRSLIDLHTAASDFTQRTPAIAKAQASNLLDQIHRDLEQAVTHKPIRGTISKPTDRVLFLIGHDTNLSNIAGLLNMTWVLDGRRDDTPPGGALIIELWQNRQTKDYSIRLDYTAQTLEQMRSASTLSTVNPPERVHVFLPSCGREDFSCSWSGFSQAIKQAIDPRYVLSKQ